MIHIIPVHNGPGLQSGHDHAQTSDNGAARGRGCIINAGTEHVCLLSFDGGLAGTDDAGVRIAAAAAGSGILMPEIEDGVVRMRAAHGGLLQVDDGILRALHSLGGIRIEVLALEQPVVKNQLVAEIWLEPAPAAEGALARIEEVCRRCRPIIDVRPCTRSRVGILTASCPGAPRCLKETVAVVQQCCIDLGCEVVFEIALPGWLEADLAVIGRFLESGTDMVIGIGFPEVDATVIAAVSRAGGSLTMTARSLAGTLAWQDHNPAVPVLWLPPAVIANRRLVAETIVPRFLAGLGDWRGEEGEQGREETGRPPGQRGDAG